MNDAAADQSVIHSWNFPLAFFYCFYVFQLKKGFVYKTHSLLSSARYGQTFDLSLSVDIDTDTDTDNIGIGDSFSGSVSVSVSTDTFLLSL